VIKYNNEIQQPGKVIGHETTVCKMDDGQKRNGRAQPPPVRADADFAVRQYVRASRILWSLAVLGLIVTYFRMFSRNVYRRQQENGAYLRQRYKVTSAWRGAVDRWHQRRDYRFFKCPSCRTRLRVPRGKGKINIVCRKCGTSFQRKT